MTATNIEGEILGVKHLGNYQEMIKNTLNIHQRNKFTEFQQNLAIFGHSESPIAF